MNNVFSWLQNFFPYQKPVSATNLYKIIEITSHKQLKECNCSHMLLISRVVGTLVTYVEFFSHIALDAIS